MQYIEVNSRLKYLNEKTKKITTQSGCYIMKDKKNTIIYIGKAKNLKNRVSSYFRLNTVHERKTQEMVNRVFEYDYIVTNTEIEALLLESSLIKLHMPKYNIALKDDRGYHFIEITSGDYPRIKAIFGMDKENNNNYLGPYLSSFSVKTIVEQSNKIFGLPTCNRVFPRDIGKKRPCLNYYIKQCDGVCTGKISKNKYNKAVRSALDFLSKDSKESIRELSIEMEEASKNMEFETAARIRDQISAIKKINSDQKVVFTKSVDQDVIALAQRGKMTGAIILKFRNGRLIDKADYLLGEVDNIDITREEFIHRYYSEYTKDIPKTISLDGPIENIVLTTEYLTTKAKKRVYIKIPQIGEQKRLVEMAIQNVTEVLSFDTQVRGKDLNALDEISRLLGLDHTPLYIEAYDISNIGEDSMVGGMVVFENGQPKKEAYKRFSIKTVVGQDDYAAMSEVITRRLRQYMDNMHTKEGFGRLPDLILLDGGQGHVSTIKPIIQSFDLEIPVFGMVKDNKHKTRAIAADGGEISILSNKSAFRMIYQIQEEVHRYAISYHRIKRKKTVISSSLTNIEGIGPARAKGLLKHYKTINAIKKASYEELASLPGMSKPSAKNVFSYYNLDNNLKKEG